MDKKKSTCYYKKKRFEELTLANDFLFCKIMQKLGKYKSKDFIYPSALQRELNIDIKTIYEILEICVQEEILEQWLKVYCPNCSRFTGQLFKNIEDIPEEVNCFNCGEDIENPLKHAVVIYRVL